MSNQLEDLPLFPLNTVLFPHATIKLNVFENRYREMVELCLREDRPFGIALIRSGDEVGGQADPYLVGTRCRIVGVHTFADGSMDIEVTGEGRFRIREIDDSHPYLMGKVEPVMEGPISDPEAAESVFVRAREEFEAMVRHAIEREDFVVKVVFPPDPVILSFTIANLVPMENIEKQRLLEMTDTQERMEALIPILERQIFDGGLLGGRGPALHQVTASELSEWIFPN